MLTKISQAMGIEINLKWLLTLFYAALRLLTWGDGDDDDSADYNDNC